MRKFYLAVFVFMLFTLGACGQSNDEDGESGNSQKFLTIATGNSGGTFFALGGAMADLFGSNKDLKVNAQSTEGSVVNVNLVKDQKAEIGFTNSSIAYYAENGVEMFDSKVDNVYAMAELYPMHYHLVVLKNSGIESIDDLAGKKIAVGEKGSGTEVNVRQILEGWDLTYDDFNASFISFSNAVEQMKNKSLDGAFVGAGVPTSSVMDLLTSGDAKLVPMENEVIEKLSETYPFMVSGEIPANSYSNQDESIETVLVGTTLVVNKDVDEDIVYDLTKTLYENLDKLTNAHSAAENIKLEKATDGMSIKLHPGALRYYEENDVPIPDHVR